MAKMFSFIKELDAFRWTWKLIYVNILQTLNILIITKNTKKVDDNTFWIEFCDSQANEKWSKTRFSSRWSLKLKILVFHSLEVRALSLDFDPSKTEESITPMR